MVELNKIKLGKNCLLDIYKSIKEGKNPSTISKELNIHQQNLTRYLSLLKSKGWIEKVGYGTWKANELSEQKELNKIKLGNQTTKQVRGHAFVWKVKIPKKINWKSLLETKGLDFKLVKRLKFCAKDSSIRIK